MTGRLSIQSRLLVLLILSGVGGSLTIGVMSCVSSETALRLATWNQLTSIRETKRRDLTRYVESQIRSFEVFATQEQLPDAIAAFRAGFAEQNRPITGEDARPLADYYQKEFLPRLAVRGEPQSLKAFLPQSPASIRLQLTYIAENPNAVGHKGELETPGEDAFATATLDAYATAHRRYHAQLRRTMSTLGLYDVFLIDADTGDVVYTVQKEVDFATNLRTGPYRDSVLAHAFRMATADANHGAVVIADFEHYDASYGAPSAVLAAPVIVDGALRGVVAGQLSIDELNAAMTASGNWTAEGLGTSGEVYLVGPDETARTDSRFLIEDPDGYYAQMEALKTDPAIVAAVKSSGHSILNQKLSTQAVQRALAGETGTEIVPDYRGIDVLSAYAPVDVGNLHWAILAEKDLSEVMEPIATLRRNILLSTGGISIALTLFSLLAARGFAGPIARLQAGVERLKAGQSNFAIPVTGNDEFASLGHAFNDMLAEIDRRNGIIDRKTAEYEQLLRSVLPDAVAHRMSGGELVGADTFENVSVVYSTLSGLNDVMARTSAGELIRLLNELVEAFDEAAERHGVEKIRTVGDAYLAVCGLSTPRLDHRQRVVAFAEELLQVVARFNEAKGCALTLQVGLASGEVDAGIVGRRRFVYEIVGACVTDARRLSLADGGPGVRMSEGMAAAIAGARG